MNVLLIHAHNEPNSFCSSMKETCAVTLRKNAHCVQLSDLYEMNWNPVASRQDFNNPKDKNHLVYALEQRHGFEQNSLSKDIANEIEKLLWADLLIFCFPLYWFSVPAILKGWFDRVLISGLCYGGTRFYSNGGLKGKKATLLFTTGGREDMLSEEGVHGNISSMLKPIIQGTLCYTGLSVLPYFSAHHVQYIDDKERLKIIEKLKIYVANIESLTPMDFVNLSAFDENYRLL